MMLLDWIKRIKRQWQFFLQKKRIIYREKKCRDKKGALERDILIYAHSLEKGMGIPNPRKGYGKEKADILVNHLRTCMMNYGINSFAFCEGIAVLDAYIALMKSQNEGIDLICEKRNEIKTDEKDYENYCKAGVKEYSYIELSRDYYKNLDDIISSRHSIRHFSKEYITEDEMKIAIALANKAPSACNRQPVKVYYTKTQEKARLFEDMVDGSHGFQGEIPYFLLVTVNRAYFSDDEYLQWYTNAGIYIGYLTLALHSCGIGSIILQWKYAQKCEERVRSLFGIRPTEAIAAIIGYGKYSEDGTKCIVAQRKRPEETMIGI